MIYETNHRHKKGSDLWHLVSTCRHLNMKIIRWTDINLTHNYEGFFFEKAGSQVDHSDILHFIKFQGLEKEFTS